MSQEVNSSALTEVIPTPSPQAEETPVREVEVYSNGERVEFEKNKSEETKGGEAEAGVEKEKPSEEGEIDPQAALKEAQAQQEATAEHMKEAGLDYSAFEKEFNEKGQLSEESLAQLEKAGYPKSMVDAYIAGIEAKNNAVVDTIIKSVGGEESFQRLGDFIRSLGDAEVDSVNSVLASNDVRLITAALKGYQAQMTLKYGTSNPTVLGGGRDNGIQGFASIKEQSAAINDPRYETDDKYRAEVQKKILASNF